MTNLLRLRAVIVAAALLAGSAACNKDKTGKESDHQADRVNENAKDLRDESRDVVETSADRRDALADKARSAARDVADEAKDVGEQAHDLKYAQDDFEYARMVRIATLRGVQSVAASQPALINAFVTTEPLEDGARAQVLEKLQIFQMRLDEAGNQIQALQGVPASTWEQRHDDVKKAMNRLDDAREDAWKALDDADRLDRTSMR
jgi:conjugal transfer/entry exclusion protein